MVITQLLLQKIKNMLISTTKNNSKNKEDYYAVLLQLNYDKEVEETAKAFFAALYFELTVNFGFNFVDRLFYRVDTQDSISNLITAAVKVVMMQQHLDLEQINRIIKHAFIIPLQQFNDVKLQIINS